MSNVKEMATFSLQSLIATVMLFSRRRSEISQNYNQQR